MRLLFIRFLLSLYYRMSTTVKRPCQRFADAQYCLQICASRGTFALVAFRLVILKRIQVISFWAKHKHVNESASTKVLCVLILAGLLIIQFRLIITKTRLYNFNPLKPHFYIVKLGFTGVYIIFLILLKKHRRWVLVRTASSRRF